MVRIMLGQGLRMIRIAFADRCRPALPLQIDDIGE